jgi:hypothetical protein
MPITRKPKQPQVDVDALIERGGSPPSPTTNNNQRMNVQLRLPRTLVDRIDAARQRRAVPVPRHTWILEAIHERLAKDDNEAR